MKNLCSQRVSGKSSFQFFSFYNSGNVLELFLKGDQAKFSLRKQSQKRNEQINGVRNLHSSKDWNRVRVTSIEKTDKRITKSRNKGKSMLFGKSIPKSLYIWWAYTDRSMNRFTPNTIIQLPNKHDKHNTGKEKNGLINWFVLVLPHCIVKT